jgi:hypothetical protein
MEPLDVRSCGLFTEGLHDNDLYEWTKYGFVASAESFEAYIVVMITKSQGYK